jgi:hypothetical protein
MAELRNIKDVRIVGKLLTARIDGVEYTFDLSRHSKRLANATAEQCANVDFAPTDFGIHWPDVDEDLSIDGMIRDEQTFPH